MAKCATVEEVLRDLLSRGESVRERVRDVLTPASRIKGYPFGDAGLRRAFHESLLQAVSCGAISVEWKPHYENKELARIRLRDARALARFLGCPFLPDRVESVFSALDMTDLPDWSKQVLAEIQTRWLMGKSAFSLTVQEAEKLPVLLAAIRGIESLTTDNILDYRQFGARFLSDSKMTKVLENPLSAFYRHHLGLVGLDASEVLAQMNLVPLAHPVLITGPLRLSDGKQSIDASVRPYVGVPAIFLRHFSLPTQPEYILTIENQSSFNEYTQLGDSRGIVIFTAGFPTRALQKFYSRLIGATDTPVFHWGDTDIGGFRILKCLQERCTGTVVKPHQMGVLHGEDFTKKQISDLKKMLPINPLVDSLVKELVKKGSGLLEQESLQAEIIGVEQ